MDRHIVKDAVDYSIYNAYCDNNLDNNKQVGLFYVDMYVIIVTFI